MVSTANGKLRLGGADDLSLPKGMLLMNYLLSYSGLAFANISSVLPLHDQTNICVLSSTFTLSTINTTSNRRLEEEDDDLFQNKVTVR